MAVNTRNSIVTNGLVLHLDAANTLSYQSGSTTWNDLSGNRNDGTLVNGPTFSGGNGGSIIFDGVNDYVGGITSPEFAVGTGNFTLEAWCYLTPTNIYSGLISSAPLTGLVGIVLSDRSCWVGNSITTQIIGDNNTKNFQDNVWFHTSFIRSNSGKTLSLKINGVDRFNPVTVTTPTSVTSQTFNVGVRYNNTTLYSWGGLISNVKFYNRALSQEEVLQNYNATKSRFNLL